MTGTIWESDDTLVVPGRNCWMWAVARSMGFEAEVSAWDALGRARSWSMKPHLVTIGEVVAHLEGHLGYRSISRNTRSYEIKCDGLYEDGLARVKDSGYRRPGSLWIIAGHERLRWYDMRHESSGDLSDPHYRQVNRFRQLEDDGYQGIIIHDFAQTSQWGNLGHVAYGLLPRGLKQVHWTRIDALHYEFGAERGELDAKDSPEFTQWRAQRDLAIARAARQALDATNETEKGLHARLS
jgi:hypothetical protein